MRAKHNNPLRSEVVLREDVIEGYNDPKPNAYFDYRTGILRVYHGSLYGGASGGLAHMAAPVPTEMPLYQVHANTYMNRNMVSSNGQMGVPTYQMESIGGHTPATVMGNFAEDVRDPAITLIMDGMIVNGVRYHGPPFSVATVPHNLVNSTLGAIGSINLEGITDMGARTNAIGNGNEYHHISGQYGAGSRNNYLPILGAMQDGPYNSGMNLNSGYSSFLDPAPALSHGALSANPWNSQPNSAKDFNRAHQRYPWEQKTSDNDAAQRYAQDMATVKADLTAMDIGGPQTFGSPAARHTQYDFDKLNYLAERAHNKEQEAKQKAEEHQKAEDERERKKYAALYEMTHMPVNEFLREKEKRDRAMVHKRSKTADNLSIGSWGDGYVAPVQEKTVDRRAYVSEDDGNDVFGGNNEPAAPWTVPVEKASWGYPGAAAITQDWKQDGNGGGLGNGLGGGLSGNF